jgi:hypothetical protein
MTDISPLMIGSPETGLYKRQLRPLSIFDRSLIVPAIWASFRKLDPRTLVKKPVMLLRRDRLGIDHDLLPARPSAGWQHQADPISVTPSQPGRALAI